MKRIENFRFNDLVLYSKGWYESSGDFYADLEKYIRMNDDYYYGPNPFDEITLVKYMTKALDEIMKHYTESEREYNRYASHNGLFELANHNMWLYNTNFYGGIIHAIYGFLQGLDKTQIKLIKPVYGKGRPRYGGWEKKNGMTYKHMNDIADRMFKD